MALSLALIVVTASGLKTRLAAAFLMAAVPEGVVESVAESGRVVEMAETPADRLNPPLQVSPGAPPVLGFRYFDASDRGRFGNLGIVADDAGH